MERKSSDDERRRAREVLADGVNCCSGCVGFFVVLVATIVLHVAFPR